jgi:hypothetical protein
MMIVHVGSKSSLRITPRQIALERTQADNRNLPSLDTIHQNLPGLP